MNGAKYFRKLMTTSAVIVALTFTPQVDYFPVVSVAHAEVKIFTGVGEYIMSDYETPEVAKKCARNYAIRNVAEQASIYIESYLQGGNITLHNDEILAMLYSMLRIIDESYKKEILNKDNNIYYVKWTSTITAKFDTNDVLEGINEWINKQQQNKNKPAQPATQDKSDSQNKPSTQNKSPNRNKPDTQNKPKQPNNQNTNKTNQDKEKQNTERFQEFTGNGKYRMGDHDTFALAEEAALIKAKRDILEQAGVLVESYSEMQYSKLTKDKITSIARGVMKIKHKSEPEWTENGRCCEITITAVVDMEAIEKFNEKKLKEKN